MKHKTFLILHSDRNKTTIDKPNLNAYLLKTFRKIRHEFY